MYGYGYQYSAIKGGELSQGEILAAAYKARVEADGGTYENANCLINFINGIYPDLYNDASLIMYPSGIKAAKDYSLKPTNGSGDLTFTRASTATRVNSSGLIEAVASNVPRIDYTGGGCGKLLLEPQRTNLFLNSEVVSSWTSQSKTTVASNTTNAPDDTLTADTIIEDNTSGLHFRGSSGLGSASTYTFSVFAKPNGRNWIYVTMYDGTADRGAYFDIQNGTIGTSDAGVTAIIQSYANGFYKCSITATTVNSFSATLQLATANGTRVYLGNNVSGVYAWGAQLELGTYPTSYIPTAGSAVTRLADAASVTVPSGTLKITETFGDDTTNVITSIPATYTATVKPIKHVIMSTVL